MKGDQQTSRAINRRLVLDHLRRVGPLSRAELATRTGLSPATITFIIEELRAEDLVREGEATKGKGGRRPVPVDIAYDARLVVGLKLTSRGVEAAVTDLATRPLRTQFQSMPDTRPETVVAHIAEVVAALVADLRPEGPPLIGVGLAVPGTYNIELGICTSIVRFGWKNVPLLDLLSREVRHPLWIDNDVNAFALTQTLFRRARGHSRLLAVAVGDGIGAAFLSGGQVHRGAGGSAGEIGHSIVVPGGRACECGRRGCLQAYWSGASLAREWAAHVAAHADAAPDLLDAVGAGDSWAAALLASAGEGIGAHLAQVANVVDPDLIVLGGEAVRFGSHLHAPLKAAFARDAYKSRPEIVLDWYPDAWACSAAALAVQRFFNFENSPG